MKKLHLIALILFSLSACTHRKRGNFANIKALEKIKSSIDKQFLRDTDSIKVFVKTAGKNEPVQIFNGKFPDDGIEYTYNILSIKNRVYKMIVSPYSESGDWDVQYTYYFNTAGYTFATEKQANAFALPDDGVAYETTIDYFNSHFENIKHLYKLADKNDKTLGKEYAFDRGDNKIKAYPTVGDCLHAYHIKL